MDQSHFLPPQQLDPTSTQLLRRVRDNDPQAWHQLVRIYGPVVRYWLLPSGLQRADLSDVFQDVFIAVMKHVPRFEREGGVAKFRSWLKQITRTKLVDHLRRRGQEVPGTGGSTAMLQLHNLPAGGESSQDDPRQSPEGNDAAVQYSEEAFLAQRALQMIRSTFQESTWKAFYRTAVDGLSSEEAAAELGLTALAVRKAKSRVLQRLRTFLKSLEGQAAPSRQD